VTDIHSILQTARDRLFLQAKIPGALGMLETFALELVRTQRTLDIEIREPNLILCAADHGAAAPVNASDDKPIHSDITLSSQDITHSQCLNFADGNGSCSIICHESKIEMSILDLGVLKPFKEETGIRNCRVADGTSSFLAEDAMTSQQLDLAMSFGASAVEALPAECNTVIFGEMGIGNSSSAILTAAAITGRPLSEYFDCGNLDGSSISIRKFDALSRALSGYEGKTAREAFIRFGGFETAAIAGGMIKAAEKGMTILLDGLITASSLLFASKIHPEVMDFAIPTHCSSNLGFQAMAEDLGFHRMIGLDMCLGEGSGAAAVVPFLRQSCALFRNLRTFNQAKVSCAYKRPLSDDFAIGTTSCIIPDDIIPNVRLLSSKVQDIELVLFESEVTSNLPNEATLMALSQYAKDNHITYTVHLPYDVKMGTESSIAVEQTAKTINLTKGLPVHAFILHLMPEKEIAYPAQDIPSWQKWCIRNVGEILKRTGIPSRMLCVENLSYDFSFAMPVIQALNLGVTIDVGHLWKYGYYSTELVKLMLTRSRVVHLHGVDDTGRDHVSLDKLDRKLLHRFLRDFAAFSKPRTHVLTLEVFSQSDLDTSLEVLKEELS
jgi:nicotinate-nucleotide--dimethylbenzimidazole phosphoribosyltransferase